MARSRASEDLNKNLIEHAPLSAGHDPPRVRPQKFTAKGDTSDGESVSRRVTERLHALRSCHRPRYKKRLGKRHCNFAWRVTQNVSDLLRIPHMVERIGGWCPPGTPLVGL